MCQNAALCGSGLNKSSQTHCKSSSIYITVAGLELNR